MEECKAWRESEFGGMGLQKNPPDHSNDNLLLFTATMHIYCDTNASNDALHDYVMRVRLEPGRFARYPGENHSSSWDCHLGLAVACGFCAKEILDYGVTHDWSFDGKWLARIPVFMPTVRAAAGEKLNWFEIALACSAFLWDCFVSKEETSGRLLLMLANRALLGNSRILDMCMGVWGLALKAKYSGPKELYSIYFHPDADGTPHPFVTAQDKVWS